MLIGNFDTAMVHANYALELAQQLNNTRGIAVAYTNLNNAHLNKGNYPLAMECALKALKIFEEIHDKKSIASVYGNIGVIYFNQEDMPQALKNYSKSYAIVEELGDKNRMATQLGNIGNIYFTQHDYIKALDNYKKALKLSEEVGDKNGSARHLGNIGNIYFEQGQYTEALEYYTRAKQLADQIDDKEGVSIWLDNIGRLYNKSGDYEKAEEYLKKAIAIQENIGSPDLLRQTEDELATVYSAKGNYKDALDHYKKAVMLKDSILSQENKKETVRKEMNFEFEKKEAVAQAEKKKQQFILLLVSCVLLLVFLFAGFIFRSLHVTRKQKTIIEEKRNEVERQKEIVEKQKDKIIDSITYAQRIQQSILIEEREMQVYLPESFIYFLPKDIVSGDFYWCSKVDNKIILAAIDCTGHGVPGAFMSLIGNTLLNQIVNEKHITTPSKILELLNVSVYEALNQQKDDALSDDGMDIALCCIDYKNNMVEYAGAQSSMYIISSNQLDVLKGDIHGIGGGGMIAKIHDPLKKEFTNHIVPLKKGMCIYLFSDGYTDQFGGANRKKFGLQKFKELLLTNNHLNLQEQKEILAVAHSEWKGKIEQIDDILVIGARL